MAAPSRSASRDPPREPPVPLQGIVVVAARRIDPTRARAEGRAMSPEQHEATIRGSIAEVFNRHDLDGLDQYWADDLVSHWMGQTTLRGLPA
jgi:hypothetical protein